jgi:hypothetical protein
MSVAEKTLNMQFSVSWRPFFLDPNLPGGEGKDKLAHYKLKFGADRVAQMMPRMVQTFAEEGIPGYSIEGNVGNTMDSHRLLEYALRQGGAAKQDKLVEVLFERYFLKGQALSSRQVLLDAAAAADLDGADALLAHAMRLATNFSETEVVRRIADAAAEVCTGEIIQTQRRFDLKLSVQDYYKIVEMKTAALFAAASELGAFLSETTPERIGALKQFGVKLGTAYQVYDDCLDLVGDEEEIGKTLGSDLRKGKLTLPLIFLLQSARRSGTHEKVSALLLGGDEVEAEKIGLLLAECGAMRQTAEAAHSLVSEALESLELLDDNRFTAGLRGVAEYLQALITRVATAR